MACSRILSMDAASTGEAPLQDAVYVSSVNKIFGVSGVYLLQFNAVTGAREAQVRIASPVMGTARLVYHAATGMLYASVWNEPNLADFSLTHPCKDVYPIDPATLAVGARLNLNSTGKINNDFDANRAPYFGPRWLGSSGNFLYVQWAISSANNGYQWLRVNPANLAQVCTHAFDDAFRFASEQACLTPRSIGTPRIYVPDPNNEGIKFGPIDYNLDAEWDECDMPPYSPVACEWSDFDGLVYAVDGSGSLLRINDPTTDNFTPFNITGTILPVPSLVPVANPCRLRYSFNDTLLYMPCTSRNSVLAFNQTTTKSTEITGFENPIDIVEVTGANPKIFAVQDSPAESLKQII